MVCRRQLKSLLDDYAQIPYKVINYLGAEINYGGRVTDDKDVRLIKTILKVYICPEALKDNFVFLASPYIQAPVKEHALYIEFIEALPLSPTPDAFGLHENADITNAQNETRTLLETLLSIQPRANTGEGKSREETIGDLATYVQSKVPKVFDEDDVGRRYPTDYNESMNTVLL
jgi:dynein heavy chain